MSKKTKYDLDREEQEILDFFEQDYKEDMHSIKPLEKEILNAKSASKNFLSKTVPYLLSNHQTGFTATEKNI
jgi:hypothetical protein